MAAVKTFNNPNAPKPAPELKKSPEPSLSRNEENNRKRVPRENEATKQNNKPKNPEGLGKRVDIKA